MAAPFSDSFFERIHTVTLRKVSDLLTNTRTCYAHDLLRRQLFIKNLIINMYRMAEAERRANAVDAIAEVSNDVSGNGILFPTGTDDLTPRAASSQFVTISDSANKYEKSSRFGVKKPTKSNVMTSEGIRRHLAAQTFQFKRSRALPRKFHTWLRSSQRTFVDASVYGGQHVAVDRNDTRERDKVKDDTPSSPSVEILAQFER